MPSKVAVRKYWSERFSEFGANFDSPEELLEDDCCFACGRYYKTERCHITAKAEGGSDESSNIHLLCSLCHIASEDMNGNEYWKWIAARSIAHAAVQAAAMHNVTFLDAGETP
jgi:hypothetical protein